MNGVTQFHTATTTENYLATDGKTVQHYGTLEPGEVLATGQPILEFPETKADMITRLAECGMVQESLNEAIADIAEMPMSAMELKAQLILETPISEPG